MIMNQDVPIRIIELTHVPLEIERQEEEKICLSNLVLEFFRDLEHPVALELLCVSSSVKDQLRPAMPHLYLIMLEIGPNNRLKLDRKIGNLRAILHRMGYKTAITSGFFPPGLVKENVYVLTNTAVKPEHALKSSGMTVAYDNLLSMMAAYAPDSLFSLQFTGNGEEVKFNILTIAKQQSSVESMYLTFIEGLKEKDNYTTRIQETVFTCGQDYLVYRWISRLDYPVISYKAISDMLQLPFGERCGIPISPQQRQLPPFAPHILNGDDVSIGTVIGSNDKKLTLPLQKVVTHMSILGISGSGKSNYLLHFLNEMYNDYNIPFLVIDPVSTEYRELKGTLNGGRLNVFTPGSEVSPFEFNLFAMGCENLTVREYKSVLSDYLRNCLNLFPPLDRLIDETIDTIFLEKGWLDISRQRVLPGDLFTLDDFIHTFDRVFEKSKFTGNLKNIAASGRVRLNSLKNYFDTIAPMPLSDILGMPTVVELGRLRSAEAKSTLLLYLLNMVKLHMMESATQRQKETGKSQVKQPCLILVIDEAHTILEMNEQGENMNIAQQGVISTINQLLLEFRKYGLSVVIADQRVSVLRDVLTNTHMQLVFKQIDPTGRQIVADIISLDNPQLLSEQKVGEAFVKHEKMEVPVQVMTPRRQETQVDTSDQAVEEYMNRDFWQQHVELTRPFKECSDCILKGQPCDRSRRSIAANIVARHLMEKSTVTQEALLKNERLMAAELLKSEFESRMPKLSQDKTLMRCIEVHLLHEGKMKPSETK